VATMRSQKSPAECVRNRWASARSAGRLKSR
jgi:hypothetical protein